MWTLFPVLHTTTDEAHSTFTGHNNNDHTRGSRTDGERSHRNRRRRRPSFSTFLYSSDEEDHFLDSRSNASSSVASLPATIVTTTTTTTSSSASMNEDYNGNNYVEEEDAFMMVDTDHDTAIIRMGTTTENDFGDDVIVGDEGFHDMALWDGIFWLEACRSMSRSVGWCQLLSVVEGIREEAYRAGMWFANTSQSNHPPRHYQHQYPVRGSFSRGSGLSSSSSTTTSWPPSPPPPPPPSSPPPPLGAMTPVTILFSQ